MSRSITRKNRIMKMNTLKKLNKKIRPLLVGGAFAICMSSSLYGQHADPFTGKKSAVKASENKAFKASNIHITTEMFSLSMTDAAKLMRETSNDSQRYEKLLKKGTLEKFSTLLVKSGETVAVHDVDEVIYPTEYEPGKVAVGGRTILNKDKKGNYSLQEKKIFEANGLPALPTAFETRNTGDTYYFDFSLDDDGKLFDLKYRYEFPRLLGFSEYGKDESMTKMPKFRTNKVDTTVMGMIGKPVLVNTFKYISKEVNAVPKIWFVMVTVSESEL